MKLQDWRAQGRTVRLRGFELFTRAEGSGEALLLIHGFPTASWDWHRLWPLLSGKFRLLALDMLGFGFSEKPKDHFYSIAEQADLHEQWLGTIGVPRVHLLAHDYGDTVAQELLARQEERRNRQERGLQIDSACFLNGGLFPEVQRPLVIQRLLASPLGPCVARLTTEKTFRRNFARVFGPRSQPTLAELAEFWELVRYNDGVAVVPRIIQYMQERARFRERWVGVLQTTGVPLRFICGSVDPVSGAHIAARYRQLIPNPDVVLLDGVGHYPHLESPQAVAGAYLNFLERGGGRA